MKNTIAALIVLVGIFVFTTHSYAYSCGGPCFQNYGGGSISYDYPYYQTPSYGYQTYFPTISYPQTSYYGYNTYYPAYPTYYSQPYYGTNGSFWGGFAGGVVGSLLGSAYGGNNYYSNAYYDNSYYGYSTYYGY